MSEVKFYQTAFEQLHEIVNRASPEQPLIEWKKKLLPKVSGSYKVKLQRAEIVEPPSNSYNFSVDINEHELKVCETVLRDMAFKYSVKNSKEGIETLKLLKAREENIDFEKGLAEMICGDGDYFPYRSSSYLTEFFQNLGHNFTHEGETRREWVKDRLNELNIREIHALIARGLFKKAYFNDCFPDRDNFKVSYPDALNEFKAFVDYSLSANTPLDLSSVLDLNVNIDLLFDNVSNTEDSELNELIEEARKRFLHKNDKQVALEKLWDAFERVKTYYQHEGLDKKKSASKLVETIAHDFDIEFINSEFNALTNIGNGYRIRHHETDKKELTPEHRNYFFFRMLSLIDLCLVYLNKKKEAEEILFD